MTAVRKDKTLASTDEALRRLFERCLLGVLVGVIIWAMLEKARDIRSAAELNTFRYVLGSLRVGLVLDRMRSAVQGGAIAAEVPRNPFLLLERPPAGYLGEVSLGAAEAGEAVAGAWFFDGRCPCIGYRPRDSHRFLAPSGSALLVFSFAPESVLAARERYLWRGEVVD